tara:strand:+ start:899 stop:1087 length:189 start_codon:yes stop_codon:yes gene_type:complete
MKTLFKNIRIKKSTKTKDINQSKFKRLPDSTAEDRRKIKEALNAGWKFVDKATWKKECRDSE